MIADTLAAAQAHLAARGVGNIDTVVVLGSGLGDAAYTLVAEPLVIPYREIPGMPASFISGHRGELLVDTAQRRAMLLGRAHLYQGVTARDVVFPIRLAAALGARRVILTNASGSLVDAIAPGELVVLTDHLNLTGTTPLDFSNPISPEPAFVSMFEAYAPALRTIALQAANRCGITLHEGIYAGVHGPAYETPAEVRMLRMLGASIVGMSTVVETIASRALGLDVLGISLATNMAGSDGTHADVLTAAVRGTEAFAVLLADLLAHLPS